MISVRLPGVLREYAGGRGRLDVEATPEATVGDVLAALAGSAPGLQRRICDEQGDIRTHVNVFVGETNVRDAQGLATVVHDAEILVLPAVSGG